MASVAPTVAVDQRATTQPSIHEWDAASIDGTDERVTSLTSTLFALSGFALFACALVVAFRVIVMDANHQLQQPGIDFAICGAIGFLGLAISWVHLGKGSRAGAMATDAAMYEQGAGPAQSLTAVPESTTEDFSIAAPATAAVPAKAPKATQQRCCPCCGQGLVTISSTRSQCRACHHVEDHTPVSFLRAGRACQCDYCRQGLQLVI